MKIILDFDDKFNTKYSEHDLKMYAAVGLYKERIMSTGDLAKAVGINRIQFMQEMGKYGENIFDASIEEIERDTESAKKFII